MKRFYYKDNFTIHSRNMVVLHIAVVSILLAVSMDMRGKKYRIGCEMVGVCDE